LENQGVLEFYEIDQRAFAMERGPADVHHVPFMTQHADMVAANRFVDLYTAATTARVPSALTDLQTRYPVISVTELAKLGGSTRAESLTTAEPPAAPNTSGGSKMTAGPRPLTLDSGCGNGCCDWNWVHDSLCAPNINGGASYTWFLYEFGNSYENSNHYQAWGASVCAGIGTSVWRLNPTDGGPFTWPVYENSYLTTSDHPRCSPPGSFCLAPSVTTTVNDQYNNHIHDYCGGVWD
jgi:hypothetical protein